MNDKIKDLLNGKNIIVTGGLGSIGSGIVDELLKYNPDNIKIIDNRETAMFYGICRRDSVKVDHHLVDVRDKNALKKVTRNADIIFHAAALKHVLVSERNPFEAIKINVMGTQNVIEACIENNVGKMILISTDKAVNPTSVMGTTKLLAERMVAAIHNFKNGINTKFGIVRFGNVLYSRGSVLEIWDKQLIKGEKITITDPSMTRFFMGIPQSIELILSATYYAKNGEIFIFKMPSCRIDTLAEAYLELKGYPADGYVSIGIKEGEKRHEELLFKEEGEFLMEKDDFLLRLPLQLEKIDIAYYEQAGFKKSSRNAFASNDFSNLLEKEKIKEILKKYLDQTGSL